MHLHEHKMIEVPAGKRGRVLTKVIWVGLIANLFITVGKIVAGWLGRSAALVSSGIHSLSDLASDAVVLILLSFSARGECRKFAYGRGKFESLASMMNGTQNIGIRGVNHMEMNKHPDMKKKLDQILNSAKNTSNEVFNPAN